MYREAVDKECTFQPKLVSKSSQRYRISMFDRELPKREEPAVPTMKGSVSERVLTNLLYERGMAAKEKRSLLSSGGVTERQAKACT